MNHGFQVSSHTAYLSGDSRCSLGCLLDNIPAGLSAVGARLWLVDCAGSHSSPAHCFGWNRVCGPPCLDRLTKTGSAIKPLRRIAGSGGHFALIIFTLILGSKPTSNTMLDIRNVDILQSKSTKL